MEPKPRYIPEVAHALTIPTPDSKGKLRLFTAAVLALITVVSSKPANPTTIYAAESRTPCIPQLRDDEVGKYCAYIPFTPRFYQNSKK